MLSCRYEKYLNRNDMNQGEFLQDFHSYHTACFRAPDSQDLATYRTLGQLDQYNPSPTVVEAIREALATLETWSLLRREQPDMRLGQLCPAHAFLAHGSREAYVDTQRVRDMIDAEYPHTIGGAEALYAGVTGNRQAQLRTSSLWVGGTSQETAAYVAPPSTSLPDLLTSLYSTIEKEHVDPLQYLGIAHSYAFLLLPFAKDNARWVTMWTLTIAQALQLPNHLILPIASGILKHKKSYSTDLMQCSQGNVSAWLNTWRQIITESLQRTADIAWGLTTLWQHLEEQEQAFGKTMHHVPPFFIALCATPYVTLSDIVTITGLTKPNASHFLKRCLKIGLLAPITFEQRNRVYGATEIIRLLGES